MSYTRFNRCIIITAVILTTIGSIITGCSFIGTRKCSVESFDRNNCYERNGKMFLERYYRLNDSNSLGLVLCGVVLNCNTSPCYNDVIVGNEYYCHHWNDKFDTLTVNVLDDGFMCLLVIGCIITVIGIGMFVSVIILSCCQYYSKYKIIK